LRKDVTDRLSGWLNVKNLFRGAQEGIYNAQILSSVDDMTKSARGRALLSLLDSLIAGQYDDYNTLLAASRNFEATKEQEINALQSNIATKDATIASLSTAVARANNGGGDSASLPNPTAFNGQERDAVKRTTQFRTWRTKIVARWHNSPVKFADEYSKITYAASLLEGTAFTAVTRGLEKVNQNPTDSTDWPWKTGAEFIAHLAARYETMDIAATAEIKLRNLTQAGKFSNYTDFLTEFTNLADECGRDDAARVRDFREKINDSLRAAVAVQIAQPAPDRWNEWVTMVSKLAVNLEGEKHRGRMYDGNNNNRAGNNNNEAPGEPMDMDAIRMNKIQVPRQEHNRRAAENLCFNCGWRGHIAKECRNPTNPGRGSGGNSARGGRGGRQYSQQRGGNSGYNNATYGQGNSGHGQQNYQQFGIPNNYSFQQGNQSGYQQAQQLNRHGLARGGAGGRQFRFNIVNVPQPGRVLGEEGSDNYTDDGSQAYSSQPHDQQSSYSYGNDGEACEGSGKA
jgi:hypothetical protein